jgi:predicted SAM-dependent methyltransferase
MAIQMKWNLGCGFDIEEGWFNTNGFEHPPVEGAVYMDVLKPDESMIGQVDYVLINHVLCVLSYDEVDRALANIRQCLKDGAVIEVIDFDMVKAFENYKAKDHEGFPGFLGSIDEVFCKSVVGYGRKSIYTPKLMEEKLIHVGFNDVEILLQSEHDLRPKESLIVRAIK